MGSSGIMASVAFIALALILYRNLSSRYLRMGRDGIEWGEKREWEREIEKEAGNVAQTAWLRRQLIQSSLTCHCHRYKSVETAALYERHTYIHTDRHQDIQTDRQTRRHTDRHTYRGADAQTEGQAYG
jgi:hypothetical protein